MENSALTHSFTWVSSTMPNFFKKLIIQFQGNARTDGGTNGRTERSYFMGSFRLLSGFQKFSIFFNRWSAKNNSRDIFKKNAMYNKMMKKDL